MCSLDILNQFRYSSYALNSIYFPMTFSYQPRLFVILSICSAIYISIYLLHIFNIALIHPYLSRQLWCSYSCTVLIITKYVYSFICPRLDLGFKCIKLYANSKTRQNGYFRNNLTNKEYLSKL